MNRLIVTLLTLALVVGASVTLLLGGEHMSGTAMAARMTSSSARFYEVGGYVLMILVIAALGSVVAWMLFGQTE